MQKSYVGTDSISKYSECLSMDIAGSDTDDTLIEIQGVTLDRSPLRVAGIYAFINLIAGTLFWFWFWGAGILSLLILYSDFKLKGLRDGLETIY